MRGGDETIAKRVSNEACRRDVVQGMKSAPNWPLTHSFLFEVPLFLPDRDEKVECCERERARKRAEGERKREREREHREREREQKAR